MLFVSKRTIGHLAGALAIAASLSSACAGRVEKQGNGQQSSAGSGIAGGASNFEQGGSTTVASGGASTGGRESYFQAGAPTSEEGGATIGGGTGVPTAGGSGQTLHCAEVICPAIPTSCKRIVQGPNDCCPTCPDTGCAECSELSCDPGTHGETAPGDCCPSCVPDPPDACERGQKLYAALRATLFEKYSSGSCKNSTECALVREDNACASVCNTALPTESVQNFISNLASSAKDCSSCAAPPQIECDQQGAACVNGKCVAVAVGP